MRGNRQHKLDANHAEVVKALRAAGISVVSLAVVVKGCGDILAGYRGINVLLEIKDGDATSKRKLTDDVCEFSESWRCLWGVVESAGKALEAVYIAAGVMEWSGPK